MFINLIVKSRLGIRVFIHKNQLNMNIIGICIVDVNSKRLSCEDFVLPEVISGQQTFVQKPCQNMSRLFGQPVVHPLLDKAMQRSRTICKKSESETRGQLANPENSKPCYLTCGL